MGSDQSVLLDSSNLKTTQINFLINGKEFSVSSGEIKPGDLLVDFIREKAGLTGTKWMCREGGCGACVCTVKKKIPDSSGKIETVAINSCLTPLLSCDGWQIETIEKLGNFHDGYHPIQKRFVEFGATQCGYCTPGMIMNMNSLLESNKKLSVVDIEDAFDGNICRCTGYRPILDACKSFASDTSEEIKRKCGKFDCCKNQTKIQNTKENFEDFEKIQENSRIYLKLTSGQEWIKPGNLQEFFNALNDVKSKGLPYRLVGGNTSTGIYKNEGPFQVFIDILGIPELFSKEVSRAKFVIGAGTSLANAIEIFKEAGEFEEFKYAQQLSLHLKRVTNTPVRNLATVGGNLMLKHFHREFPSDIFTIFESVGAKVNISFGTNFFQAFSLLEFLNLDMHGKILIGIEFPILKESDGFTFKSFKITQRYQNSHAYVNAGFLFRVDKTKSSSVVDIPRIVFGGINPQFTHATETENFLIGKSLENNQIIQEAMKHLDREVKPDHILPDATPEYRKLLAQSLLYKTILGILGNKVSNVKLHSGSENLERKLTAGVQNFDTDTRKWPINEPVKKLEAFAQTSGEAEYTQDIVKQNGELFGKFLLSEIGNADLEKIDASEALAYPGIVDFIQASDIPGLNDTEGPVFTPVAEIEELFVTKKIGHAGQALGMLIGESRDVVDEAIKKIKIIYSNRQLPILTIADSLKKTEQMKSELEQYLGGSFNKDFEKSFQDLKLTNANEFEVQGKFEIGSQYHFTMETHSVVVVPKEDGTYDIFPTSQWMNHAQKITASVLKISNNCINMQVKRLGGGYGCKVQKTSKLVAAAALAALKTRRPIRAVMDLETTMSMIGKRLPYLGIYKVGFDSTGRITENKTQYICDAGINTNGDTSFYAKLFAQSCYQANGDWDIQIKPIKTNTHPNTWARAPGSTQAVAILENSIEHIARVLKKDPLEIRLVNLIREGDSLYPSSGPGDKFKGVNQIPNMIAEIKMSGEYEERKKFVEKFNENHRWKKRGISLIPVRYSAHYFFMGFSCFISIYGEDGSVSVSHAGIEMGQGINTKVSQVVARYLKIPMDKIKVKAANNLISPNAPMTAASVSSELACFSAIKASEIITKRLAPIKEKMGPDVKWEELILESSKLNIDLTATYRNQVEDGLQGYDVYMLNLTEVEVDILTGEFKIVRVDLIEDAGISISPEVDIGQIEGALVFGLGLWTTEKIVYDPDTAQLLTNNTWRYKPPTPRDIPEDMRITLLKNAPNPFGVLRSKTTGEPAVNTGVAVLFALRNAIDSARFDANKTKNEFYRMDGPLTPEDIIKYALTGSQQFVI